MAALYDVKAKLSEYVTMAEKGDVIEITKHGRTSAVIIGIDEYNNLKKYYKPSFVEQVNKWRIKTGGLSEDEWTSFNQNLTREKEVYSREGLF